MLIKVLLNFLLSSVFKSKTIKKVPMVVHIIEYGVSNTFLCLWKPHDINVYDN